MRRPAWRPSSASRYSCWSSPTRGLSPPQFAFEPAFRFVFARVRESSQRSCSGVSSAASASTHSMIPSTIGTRLVVAGRAVPDEQSAQLLGDPAEVGDGRLHVHRRRRRIPQRQQVAVSVQVLARLAELGQPESAAQREVELRQRLGEELVLERLVRGVEVEASGEPSSTSNSGSIPASTGRSRRSPVAKLWIVSIRAW